MNHGISTFGVSAVWEKINAQVKSELYEGKLQSKDIPNRIDQLVLENANLEKMIERKEKAKQTAENNANFKEIQKEKRAQKHREEGQKIGITVFDFKCQIYETRMNIYGNNEKDLVDAYCYVQQDKLVVKKISLILKHDMGDKIVPYSNIKAIDFDKAGVFLSTGSIVIYIGGYEPVILKETNEDNFKLLNEAWQNYSNLSNNNAQIVNNAPQPTNADELLKYAELYKQGLLTEEEFEAKKKELL